MRVAVLGHLGDGKTVVARYLHTAHGFNQLHVVRGRPLREGPPRPLDLEKLDILRRRIVRYNDTTPLVVDDAVYKPEVDLLTKKGFAVLWVVRPGGPSPRRRDEPFTAYQPPGAKRIIFGSPRGWQAQVDRWVRAQR